MRKGPITGLLNLKSRKIEGVRLKTPNSAPVRVLFQGVTEVALPGQGSKSLGARKICLERWLVVNPDVGVAAQHVAE